MPPNHKAKNNLRAESGSTRLMGTTADQRGPRALKGWDYGKNGAWKNPNGVQVGQSDYEDSEIHPMKSTGDMANAIHIHLHGNDSGLNLQKAAKLRNKKYKGKAGY